MHIWRCSWFVAALLVCNLSVAMHPGHDALTKMEGSLFGMMMRNGLHNSGPAPDNELASMTAAQESLRGGLRRNLQSQTLGNEWYVEKLCGQNITDLCASSGVCGRGEGIRLGTCIPAKGLATDPMNMETGNQFIKYTLSAPDFPGVVNPNGETAYKVQIQAWRNGDCTGNPARTWPNANSQKGTGDFIFERCDGGVFRKRMSHANKPWGEYPMAEVQNLNEQCESKVYFNGYDFLGSCLKGDYAGKYATCSEDTYRLYNYVGDPATCKDHSQRITEEAHVLNECVAGAGVEYEEELLAPGGVVLTSPDIMYYCNNMYDQDEEQLTSTEMAVAAITCFFFALVCFNVYYFFLRQPPQPGDEDYEEEIFKRAYERQTTPSGNFNYELNPGISKMISEKTIERGMSQSPPRSAGNGSTPIAANAMSDNPMLQKMS